MADDNPNLLKHLEFIQLTIARMAANSFIIKGWAVTLVAAILAFTTTENTCKGAWLALIPATMFWGLDGYFLRQERLFRRLYDQVRLRTDEGATNFSMNTSGVEKEERGWLAVQIHGIQCPNQGVCFAGRNPFDDWQVKQTNGVAHFLKMYPIYDWVSQNGAKNLPMWIEDAARRAGR